MKQTLRVELDKNMAVSEFLTPANTRTKGLVAPAFQVSVKLPCLIFKQCTIIILIFLSLFPFPQQKVFH